MARQRWLDTEDFKNNFTDMTPIDCFKIFLLAMAEFENNLRLSKQ